MLFAALLTGLLALSGCTSSNSNKNAATATPSEDLGTAGAGVTAIGTARGARTAIPTISIPGLASGTAGASGSPGATPAARLSPADLARLALQTTDLPSGFALADSGPGGPELGFDVTASYQEQFQQRDVTSTLSLQQTIIVIDLLGQYKDATSATSGVKSVTVQSLNQILTTSSLSAELAAIPAIGEDSAGYHFSGDTNGVAVGGYLIVFHRGTTAALVVTAAIRGAESLPQTLDLAQKQDQKLRIGT